MKTSPIKILLLASIGKNDNSLKQALDENNYETESLSDIEIAIEKITNQSYDLVICENNVGNYSGFAVFKMLIKYLRNYGVPFFLVLDSYEKEDMLIGLEIGIDNFIVHPINKDSISYKIENQLRKREELNIFETDSFKNYFFSSLIAMFFIEDNKITLVNQAFNKLFNGSSNEILENQIHNIFNIAENRQNELNFGRFQNGITKYCKLVGLQLLVNADSNFDVSLYRGKNRENSHIFAEIVENKIGKETDQLIDEEKSNVVLTEQIYTENIKLTGREQQVFVLSANGLPIKIIANKLGLSERTVEKHRANIMAKAKAKNMIEAIIRIQNGNVTEYSEMKF